jgi:hypothetical protein
MADRGVSVGAALIVLLGSVHSIAQGWLLGVIVLVICHCVCAWPIADWLFSRRIA